MTWFRAGGGGIPASLKNGMNAVLNKKFGTSGQTYAPSDWPDDVNLLGKLPEKTVSGTIVTFPDGADAVPLKKCEVTLPASLDGYSEIDVVHTGKNLLNDSIKTKVGGSILFAGASSSSDVNIILPAGTYTMTLKLNVNINVNLYLKDIDTNTNITGFPYYNTASTEPKSRTFTLDHTTRLCAWTYNGDFTSTSEVDYCMIEAGSTATTYEPYTAPTTHTASLGRTIHGGTVDVANGQGGSGYIKYVIDGVNNYGYLTPSNNMNIMPYGLFNVDTNTNHWACNISTNFGYNAYNGFVFLRQAGWSSLPDVTDAPSFNAYCQENPIVFIIPLATAEQFTFDPVPIDSKLGNNTIWSEHGSSAEVTYRADIDLVLAQLSGTRSLMMASRSVSPMIGEEASLDRENILEEMSENSDNEESEEER